MNGRRVAMVTGATGGLGRVLAADLAAEGWDLALVSSSTDRLEALVAELALDSARVLTTTADLLERDAARTAVEAAYQRFGRVDALAHLVGGWTGGTYVARCPDDPFRDMLDQHLWTSLNVLRELTPRLVEAGFGRVVSVSSPMAAAPEAGMSAYGVAKAAQETLYAALAREVAGTGVTVNVVRVRAIDTAAGPEGSSKAGAASPAEISAAVRYLFGESARVVNGSRLSLTGGA